MANLIFSFEGIDGSGKSTQTDAVAKELGKLGLTAVVLRSPRHDLFGEFIRRNVRELDPWLRNRLFLLDIEVSLREEAEVHTDAVLLWDRYIDSFYASNPEMTLGDSSNLTAALPLPLRTFFLDIDPSYIFEERADVVDEHSVPEWLQLKSERYGELATLFGDRILAIDARQPQDEITKQIITEIVRDLDEA